MGESYNRILKNYGSIQKENIFLTGKLSNLEGLFLENKHLKAQIDRLTKDLK
jgi:hypothetical protein